MLESAVAWRIANALEPLLPPDVPAFRLSDAARADAMPSPALLTTIVICDPGAAHEDRLVISLQALVQAMTDRTQILLTTESARTAALTALLNRFFGAAIVDIVAVAAGASVVQQRIAAVPRAQGRYLTFLEAGDRVEPGALSFLQPLLQDDLAIVYTDEDWMTADALRVRPRLKSGWDPDAHLGRDLFGRLAFFRRDVVDSVGGIQERYAPAEIYDLSCRVAFASAPTAIVHVPVTLCHRTPPAATKSDDIKLYYEAQRNVAAASAQALCGQPVVVVAAPNADFIARVRWPMPDPAPLVSILVPTRDRGELVANCVAGLCDRTAYANLEILILDNDSVDAATFRVFADLTRDKRVRVVPAPGPFNFSRINNLGAAQAHGSILLFLNNDVEVDGLGWLDEMVRHVLRPDVGCVGARLLYADRHLQHAGIVLKPGPLAMHILRRQPEQALGYDGQLGGVRSYAAVTAACLAIRRELFERVGGFDEEALQISFQDVDLSLKVAERGYRNICTPFEPLLHLEGATRGASPVDPEQVARERRELTSLVHRWRDQFDDDRMAHPCVQLDWSQPERVVALTQTLTALDLAR